MHTAYHANILQAATNYALPPDLVEALVLVESSGKTYAYRYESAFWTKYLSVAPEWKTSNPERVAASYGLMQIMYVVAREVGFTSPDPELLFVPDVGLDYGCRKLRQLLDWSKGNVEQALAAYNGGKVANAAPPYRNGAYARRVLAILSALNKETV